MYIAIWIFVLVAWALWSLLAWGLHALLSIDPAWVEDVQALIQHVPYADLIDRWVPGWREMLGVGMDLAQTALGWVGTNAPLVAWIVWGVGTLGLLAAGGVLSLIVSLLRERKPAGAVHA